MRGVRLDPDSTKNQVSERVCQREPLRDRALSPHSRRLGSRERSRRDSRVSGLRTACGGGGWGGSCGGDRGVCARPVARPHDRRDPRVNTALSSTSCYEAKPVTLSAPGRSWTGCVLFRSVAHAERADGSQQQRKRKTRPQHGPEGWGASIARASISSVAPSTAAASRWMPR